MATVIGNNNNLIINLMALRILQDRNKKHEDVKDIQILFDGTGGMKVSLIFEEKPND